MPSGRFPVFAIFPATAAIVVCVALVPGIDIWLHFFNGEAYDPWLNDWTVRAERNTVCLAILASALASLSMVKKEYRKFGWIIIGLAIVAVASFYVGLETVKILPDG